MVKILLVSLILVLITVFIFIFKDKQGVEVNPDGSPLISSEDPLPIVESLPQQSALPEVVMPFLTSASVKRQFDPNSKFVIRENKLGTPFADFPKEITEIDENRLEKMKCTNSFTKMPLSEKFNYYREGKRQDLEVGDTTYQQILELIRKEAGAEEYKITSFQYCLLDEGDIIVYYQRIPNVHEKEDASPDNFLLVSLNKEVKKVGMNINTPIYFNCPVPLQYTNDKILYYHCKGGDVTSWEMIERINFNNLTGQEILKCHLGEEVYDGSLPLVCK